MQVELSRQDLSFLREHLLRRLQAVEEELLHADKVATKHALADDARRLRHLIERLPS
jgi:hypothetical protein